MTSLKYFLCQSLVYRNFVQQGTIIPVIYSDGQTKLNGRKYFKRMERYEQFLLVKFHFQCLMNMKASGHRFGILCVPLPIDVRAGYSVIGAGRMHIGLDC